uniref:Uncharacterized protein n=1 Tax=Escherichia coli TaxID=562 RepID=Q08JC0_ECOLX|nr:hypothetical protein [Escherichia coli]
MLSRKCPDLVMPDALAAEESSKREWNRFLDTHTAVAGMSTYPG